MCIFERRFVYLMKIILKLILFIIANTSMMTNPIELIHDDMIKEDTKNNTVVSFLDQLGEKEIQVQNVQLVRYKLPADLYPGIDHSSFQPYMDYRAVKNKKCNSYKLLNGNTAYCDKNGFRRIKVTEDDFSLDMDDYVVALGNYYKEKGSVGDRFVVVTTTGMYTMRVGDEKADRHTEKNNMFTRHGGKAAVIEWIVDTKKIDKEIKRRGTVTVCDIEALQGKLIHIYKIIES